MAVLALLIGGVSLSSFQLFRAEVSALSSSTLPKVIAAAELRGALQKLVAGLPVLAAATTTPERRAIHGELVDELAHLNALVERLRSSRDSPDRKAGAPSVEEGDERLLEQVRSTLRVLATMIADLDSDVARQIAADERQIDAVRALADQSDGLERLSGMPADGPVAPWVVRAGTLMARVAGATRIDHLYRLTAERRGAEATLAELGRMAAATPPPAGPAMERMRADLSRILVAPGGMFDSAAARLQARHHAQALSQQSRMLVETVDRATSTLFDALNGRSTARTDALGSLIRTRSHAVMGMAIASLLLAAAVYAFFRRFLTSRLVALNAAVLARLPGADGDPVTVGKTDVPVGGDDEITDIAASVRYFTIEIERRQRDVADSERRFRDLVEGSIQGIVIHRDFRPLYVNEAFARMLDVSVTEALAMPSVLVPVAETEWRAAEESYHRVIETGMPSNRRRIRARTLQGTELWVELTSRRVDWMGEAAVQSVVVDVTREVEAEAALRHSRDAAEEALQELKEAQASLIQAEKMASLGALVAGVAHEVNTPIGIAITGASQLSVLLEELAGQFAANSVRRSDFQRFLTDGQEMSRLILSNALRAADLVQSFKMVAVDQSSDERRPFDLKTYVGDLLRSLRPAFKEREGLEVDVEVPEGLELDGYPGALSHILTNLIVNALTHAFADGRPGTLTIAGRRLPPDQVELLVADDGAGIPAEVLPKIFDPFFTTRRGSGGSGLGLHIVYNLVTGTLRGSIAVSSRPDSGTRFTLRFPRITPDRPPAVEGDGAGV